APLERPRPWTQEESAPMSTTDSTTTNLESGDRRAIGYLRVSTSLQAENGLGLEVQRDAVREYASNHGLELVDVVQEAASGGVRGGELFSWERRPVLLQLIDRAERGEFDVLLVARLDRLSRDYATLVVLERMLERHNVEVISAAEENGDGPVAEYLRGNLALIAELERGLIRQRLDYGRSKARRLGNHAGGRIPYGYLAADKSLPRELRKLRIDAQRSEVVKRIFRLARDGNGPAPIARQRNEAQILAPSATPSNRQTITNILRTPSYTGELHGVRRAQPAIVSRQLWNGANG